MKIIAANWKLNKSPREAKLYFKELLAQAPSRPDRQLVIFPSATSLETASEALADSQIKWGPQNCYFEGKGAFTGEISAQVIKEMGGAFVLIGHSERRVIFRESDETIAKKLQFVQSLGLVPMLCIGESLGEREGEQTFEVIAHQLGEALKHADSAKPLMIAYEPVWAIGTGKVASSHQVMEAHHQVFKTLKTLGFSQKTPILYGGSVKAENAKELISIEHVDGFLIGGAALEVKSYLAIANA